MRALRLAVVVTATLSLASSTGCGSLGVMVPLVRAAGMPWALVPDKAIPLEVVTRGAAVRDPLPVAGSSVSYGELEEALGIAVSASAAHWADAHRAAHPGGYQVLVELTSAEAERRDERIIVSLRVRATLRERAGDIYLAQTQAACQEALVTRPERGAGVVYACMGRIGQKLAGWMESVVP